MCIRDRGKGQKPPEHDPQILQAKAEHGSAVRWVSFALKVQGEKLNWPAGQNEDGQSGDDHRYPVSYTHLDVYKRQK